MSDNLPSKSELLKKLEGMPDSERKKASSVLARLGFDITQSKPELRGTEVVGFIFENKKYEARGHKDAYVKFIGIISLMFTENIDKMFSIKGTKKTYFSYNHEDFRHSYESISFRNGKKIYIDTNENASQLNKRCQRVLQCFGLSPEALEVLTK